VIFLAACSPSIVETPSASETALPPATETSVPTDQSPTLEPATQTATSQPAIITDWLSRLEVIQAGNWSRLQLLKTFPAEMPLSQSAIAISSDGKTMAVGSREGARIFFFDVESGQLLRTIPMGISNIGNYFRFGALEYLPDGTMMASSTGPYATYHIDTDGNLLAMWDGNTFALSADKKVMVHNDDAGLTLVDITSNTSLVSLENESGLDFSLSPNGSKLAVEDVGMERILTTIWDVPSKTFLKVLMETAAPRYSPDGKFLAAIYYDYENDRTPLKIFSPDGRTEVTSLNVSEPEDLTNRAPVWSIDGSVIAAQIANGSPAGWDTTNWQLLDATALQGELSAFSPNGRILITRTPDGGIILWGVLP
jgi:WD40 repeat protein